MPLVIRNLSVWLQSGWVCAYFAIRSSCTKTLTSGVLPTAAICRKLISASGSRLLSPFMNTMMVHSGSGTGGWAGAAEYSATGMTIEIIANANIG